MFQILYLDTKNRIRDYFFLALCGYLLWLPIYHLLQLSQGKIVYRTNTSLLIEPSLTVFDRDEFFLRENVDYKMEDGNSLKGNRIRNWYGNFVDDRIQYGIVLWSYSTYPNYPEKLKKVYCTKALNPSIQGKVINVNLGFLIHGKNLTYNKVEFFCD